MSPAQTIADMIQARFTAPVLAAVAALPQETIEAEEGLTPAFIDRIVGKAELNIGKMTYSFNADCRAILHFQLKGDTSFFQAESGSLLGKNWSCGKDQASVTIPPDMQQQQQAIKAALPAFKGELTQAVQAYHAQWNAGRQALDKVAQEAYWRRVNVERAMAELKVPKVPKEAEVPGVVPESPSGLGVE